VSTKEEKIAQTKARIERMEKDQERLALKLQAAKEKLALLESAA